MRLNILLVTGAILTSVLALPASSAPAPPPTSTSSSSPPPPPSSPPKADGKSILLRRDLLWLLSEAYNTLGRLHGRYLQWRLERGLPQNRDDDVVLIIAPDGEEVFMTLEQRRAVDACRSLMSKRKASPQEIFDQCREWAMNPERTIEDLDYGPSQTQAEPSPEDMATQNGNHNNDNSHFSKVVVDQGRQSIRRFGENVKNTIPKIMAPLVAAKDKGKKGGLIAPSHDVGSLGVPRVPMAPPL